MARKFNIYCASLQEGEPKSRWEVNGVEEPKLRDMFDVCKVYGPCKFVLGYQGAKLSHNCVI